MENLPKKVHTIADILDEYDIEEMTDGDFSKNAAMRIYARLQAGGAFANNETEIKSLLLQVQSLKELSQKQDATISELKDEIYGYELGYQGFP